MNARLRCLNRIPLIMDRRRGAGEVVDLVDLDEERECNIVPQELEVRMIAEMSYVLLGPSEQIVDAEDLMAVVK